MSSLSPQSSWVNLGPAPISNGQTSGISVPVSGRVTAIAVAPTSPPTIYVGAAQGGVWRSIDNGSSWTALTDNQPTLAVGSIALSPANPNTIYVGTGEGNLSADSYFGEGILKSTDAGNTWTLLGQSTFSGISISKIVVDPVNPNNVYAGTILGIVGMGASYPPSIPSPVVYKSQDGGISWSALSNGLPNGNGNGICDLVIDPFSPNVLYAAVNNMGIYMSTNSGASWSHLTSGLPASPGRASLTLSRPSAGTSATLYAGLDSFSVSTHNPARVYKSTNGISWVDVTDSNVLGFCDQQCWYDNVILADPTDPNVVFVAGINYSSPRWGIVFRSTNGGGSWTDLGSGLHPDSHALAVSPGNTNIVYTGDDGGIFYSPDRGGSFGDWVSLNTNLSTLQFESVALHPTNPSITIGGSQDNGTDIYQGSPAWTLGYGGDGGFTAVDFSNPANMYSTYVNNNPLMSSDGGVSWNNMIRPPGSDRYGFYAPMVMDSVNANVLYFGGSRLYRTPDRGLSGWFSISSDLTKGGGVNSVISAIAAARSNSSFIYVGTSDGNVQMTANLGATWANATRAPLPNRYVTRVAIDPVSAQTAYVTYSGFNGNTPSTPGHVFKTTNSGASWTNVSSNLPDIPMNVIVVDPTSSNVLYVGSDVGVYATSDGGASWSVFGVGFPNVAVFDLRISSSLCLLRAATHGRSVFSIPLAGCGAPTSTPTSTGTATPTASVTPTSSQTFSPTPTNTATNTPISGVTLTATNSPTDTSLPTITPTVTVSPTPSATATLTTVPSVTPTTTVTATAPSGSIFADGFETGDFSKWTTTTLSPDPGSVKAVISGAAHAGAFGAELSNGTGVPSTSGSTVSKIFTAPANRIVSAQTHIRVNALSGAGTVRMFQLRDSVSGQAVVRMRYASGVAQLLLVRRNLTQVSTSFTTNLTTGTWHLLELMYDWSGAQPVGQAWVDGVLQATIVDTSSGSAIVPNTVFCMVSEDIATATADAYFDEVRVANGFIGSGSTATVTPTPTASATPTASPTTSASPTATSTQIPTASPTPSPTNTSTPTAAPSVTPTVSPTASASPTLSPTPTIAATNTATNTPILSVTPTTTNSPTDTSVPTVTPTPTISPTPSATATLTTTPVPSATPTATNSPTDTSVPTITPSPTISPTPSTTATSMPVTSGTATPTPTISPTPSSTPTTTGTATPSSSTIFTDGFETGNLANWTTTTLGPASGSVISVVPSAAFSGSFGAHVSNGIGGTLSKGSSISKIFNVPVNRLVDAQTQIKVNALSGAGTLRLFQLRDSVSGQAVVRLRYANGVAQLLLVRRNLTQVTISFTTNMTTGTWHLLELKYDWSGVQPVGQAWVDGVLQAQIVDTTTGTTIAPNTVFCMVSEDVTTASADVYFDDVQVTH